MKILVNKYSNRYRQVKYNMKLFHKILLHILTFMGKMVVEKLAL
jgi:hypothetical protein